MLIDQVKVGDVLTVAGTGYQSNIRNNYTVMRITKTMIVCTIPKHATGYEYKIDRYGCKLPREKYINHYVTHINGIEISNE